MPNISVTCAEIQTAGGFEFSLPSGSLNQTLTGDCDHSWYLEDGRLLADPSDPETLMAPALSVSSDGLVSSLCVNLSHEIICHSDGFRHETLFRVRNGTDSSGGPTPESHPFWWLLALFVIFVIILMCFVLSKRIFRHFLKAEMSNLQRNDNRDPESGVQMKLKSDESESQLIKCHQEHPVILHIHSN